MHRLVSPAVLSLTTACSFDSYGLDRPKEPDAASTTTGSYADSTTQTTVDSTGFASSDEGSSTAATCGSGWWDDRWTFRRKVTLTPADLDEALTNVPVLVRLDETRIDAASMQPAAEDLRFVASDHTTPLSYEIERWNAEDTSFVWIALPTIPPAGSEPVEIWMYYGNEAAADAQSPEIVWADAFISVHHLDDHTDSTGSGHEGFGDHPPTPAAGQIGRGGRFNGIEDYLELPNESDFALSTAVTVEAWLRVDAFTVPWQAIVTKGDTTWRLHRHASDATVAFGTNIEMSKPEDLAATAPVDDGQWHYAVVAYNGFEKAIYIDGELQGSAPVRGALDQDPSPVMIGANAAYPERKFAGIIDEVRISSRGRSPGWVALQYQAMRDKLLSFGEQELCM
jgi:biopolymer transport protein ExbB